MAEESKVADPKLDDDAAKDLLGQSSTTDQDSAEENEPTDSKDTDSVAASSAAKKKKSKKAKLKKALRVGGNDAEGDIPGSSSKAASKLTGDMVDKLLEINPSLKSEVAGMDKEKTQETLKKMDVADLLTGLVNHSEMLSIDEPDLGAIGSEWEESKRYGVLQVLADATCPTLRSVFQYLYCTKLNSSR